jgi:hypothetical protein
MASAPVYTNDTAGTGYINSQTFSVEKAGQSYTQSVYYDGHDGPFRLGCISISGHEPAVAVSKTDKNTSTGRDARTAPVDKITLAVRSYKCQ